MRDVTVAEKMESSGEGEIHRSRFCLTSGENVAKEVMVEEPLGRRMRMSGEDWGELDEDLSEPKRKKSEFGVSIWMSFPSRLETIVAIARQVPVMLAAVLDLISASILAKSYALSWRGNGLVRI